GPVFVRARRYADGDEGDLRLDVPRGRSRDEPNGRGQDRARSPPGRRARAAGRRCTRGRPPVAGRGDARSLPGRARSRRRRPWLRDLDASGASQADRRDQGLSGTRGRLIRMSWKLKQKAQALLAAERGTVRRDWGGRVSIALVYPNTYAVGMSNLGFQTIYRHLNSLPHLLCDPPFLPDS